MASMFLGSVLLVVRTRWEVYFRRFEPADKTGPDAMEYRRLQLMMKCSSAEEIPCVQSACLLLPTRFIKCCSNSTIPQNACTARGLLRLWWNHLYV